MKSKLLGLVFLGLVLCLVITPTVLAVNCEEGYVDKDGKCVETFAHKFLGEDSVFFYISFALASSLIFLLLLSLILGNKIENTKILVWLAATLGIASGFGMYVSGESSALRNMWSWLVTGGFGIVTMLVIIVIAITGVWMLVNLGRTGVSETSKEALEAETSEIESKGKKKAAKFDYSENMLERTTKRIKLFRKLLKDLEDAVEQGDEKEVKTLFKKATPLGKKIGRFLKKARRAVKKIGNIEGLKRVKKAQVKHKTALNKFGELEKKYQDYLKAGGSPTLLKDWGKENKELIEDIEEDAKKVHKQVDGTSDIVEKAGDEAEDKAEDIAEKLDEIKAEQVEWGDSREEKKKKLIRNAKKLEKANDDYPDISKMFSKTGKELEKDKPDYPDISKMFSKSTAGKDLEKKDPKKYADIANYYEMVEDFYRTGVDEALEREKKVEEAVKEEDKGEGKK